VRDREREREREREELYLQTGTPEGQRWLAPMADETVHDNAHIEEKRTSKKLNNVYHQKATVIQSLVEITIRLCTSPAKTKSKSVLEYYKSGADYYSKTFRRRGLNSI